MSLIDGLEDGLPTTPGYVIVLPGIEGYSRWNRAIVRGLRSAGIGYDIEIHDWTYGRFLSPVSLRSRGRHRQQADIIADKIKRFRGAHPEAPVWLIGHSGGGALSVLVLERLCDQQRIEGAILLAPAISPGYDLSRALQATTRGLWNFSSWGDAFFLMFGTLLLGTLDGRHSVSAGACGFRTRPEPARSTVEGSGWPEGTGNSSPAAPRLTEVPWRPAMLRDGHFAGHFGPVNPRFVRQWIAPILQGSATKAEEGQRTGTPQATHVP